MVAWTGSTVALPTLKKGKPTFRKKSKTSAYAWIASNESWTQDRLE